MTRAHNVGRRGMAMAAVATRYFERTQYHHSQARIQLDAELLHRLQHHGGLTFEAIGYTTTVRSYAIDDVVLDADTLLLVQDGFTSLEMAYFVPTHRSQSPAIDHAALIRLP